MKRVGCRGHIWLLWGGSRKELYLWCPFCSGVVVKRLGIDVRFLKEKMMTDEQAQEIIDQLQSIHATVKLVFWAICGLAGLMFGITIASGR